MRHAQLDLSRLAQIPNDPPAHAPFGRHVWLPSALLTLGAPATLFFFGATPLSHALVFGALAGGLSVLWLTLWQRSRFAQRVPHLVRPLWLLYATPWLLFGGRHGPPWVWAALGSLALIAALFLRAAPRTQRSGDTRAGLDIDRVEALIHGVDLLTEAQRALVDEGLLAYGLIYTWLSPQASAPWPCPLNTAERAHAAHLHSAAREVIHQIAEHLQQIHRALHTEDSPLPDWQRVIDLHSALLHGRDAVIQRARLHENNEAQLSEAAQTLQTQAQAVPDEA